MLVEFSIQNFGSIRDIQTISMLADSDKTLEDYYVVNAGGLRLLKLAVIFGPNASGKTMILKALNFMREMILRPKQQKSDEIPFYPFQFDEASRNGTTTFKLIFIEDDIRHDYEIEFTSRYIVREEMSFAPNGRAAVLFSRITDPERQVSTVSFGSKVKINSKSLALLEGNTLWNSTVPAAFTKSNIDLPELQRVQNWFDNYLQALIQPGDELTEFANNVFKSSDENRSMMASFLQKADVQIAQIRLKVEEESLPDQPVHIIPNQESNNEKLNTPPMEFQGKNLKLTRNSLFFMHRIKSKGEKDVLSPLPWEFESHGTMTYYRISAILAMLIQGRFAYSIDELESSLHPELMKHFILTFLANAKKSQLIFTSHNITFLEEKDLIRKDAVWFTQKRPDGSTELYSLADFDSSVFRKNSSIINAYKTGKIGAVPSTGSIFLQPSE